MRVDWRFFSHARLRCALLLILFICGHVVGTARADHANLEEGLPVEVTDAYPLGYLGREVQARTQYRHTPQGADEIYLEPRFEFGFAYNAQLALRLPLVSQRAEESRQLELGRAGLEAMYNFNQESLVVPAVSLAGGVELPDTMSGGSFDPYARLLISKQLPGTTFWHRLHLNGLLQANVAGSTTERDLRYLVIAGYDFRITPTIVGVVDYVRDQPFVSAQATTNLGEAGIRIALTPLLAVSLGGGAGADDDGNPLARGTAALQYFAF